MGPIAEAIFDGAIVATITAILTWMTMTWRMEKKYRTVVDASVCMKEREKNEAKIEEAIDRMKNRLILGNMILLRLCKEMKISEEEIRQMKNAVEVDMHNER